MSFLLTFMLPPDFYAILFLCPCCIVSVIEIHSQLCFSSSCSFVIHRLSFCPLDLRVLGGALSLIEIASTQAPIAQIDAYSGACQTMTDWQSAGMWISLMLIFDKRAMHSVVVRQADEVVRPS
jgi:hypothetical protein